MSHRETFSSALRRPPYLLNICLYRTPPSARPSAAKSRDFWVDSSGVPPIICKLNLNSVSAEATEFSEMRQLAGGIPTCPVSAFTRHLAQSMAIWVAVFCSRRVGQFQTETIPCRKPSPELV